MADHEREPPDEIRAAVERAREELRRELAGEAERVDLELAELGRRMNESAARVAESRVEREMERLDRASAALSRRSSPSARGGRGAVARRTRRAARGERRRAEGREPTLAARALGGDPGRRSNATSAGAARWSRSRSREGSRSASTRRMRRCGGGSTRPSRTPGDGWRQRIDERLARGGARSADGDRRRPYGASRADHDTHHRLGRSPRSTRRQGQRRVARELEAEIASTGRGCTSGSGRRPR